MFGNNEGIEKNVKDDDDSVEEEKGRRKRKCNDRLG